jgi:hypothetical protein
VFDTAQAWRGPILLHGLTRCLLAHLERLELPTF